MTLGARLGDLLDRLAARLLRSPARFDRLLRDVEESAAHGRLCQRVHGENLRQLDMVDAQQLAQLWQLLRLDAGRRVLDLCCGNGYLAEQLAARSGARVTGIDFAPQAIARAQRRSVGLGDRLCFALGHLDRLDLAPASYDVVIAVDALYFARDLDATVAALARALAPGGEMALFFSQVARAAGAEILRPEGTWLAQALRTAGLGFSAHDFSAGERRLWRRLDAALAELRPDFAAEGRLGLYRVRRFESRKMLRLAEAGRLARYLYHVSHGERRYDDDRPSTDDRLPNADDR